MAIMTIGVDTSKSWFQVHGVDDDGQAVLRRKLARSKVLPFFCQPDAVHDRPGGLRRSALLGARAGQAGA